MNNSGHSNYYKTSEKEREFIKRLRILKSKSQKINDIMYITNTILSNCAYHDKNIAEQNERLNKLNVPQDELELISNAWQYKHDIAIECMHELKELLDMCKIKEVKTNTEESESMEKIYNDYKKKVKENLIKKCQ